MSKIDTFKTYYKEISTKLNDKMNKFNKELVNDQNNEVKYNEELFANLNSDGKLVRGTLVNLGYNLLKEDKDYSLDLSLAYEVFQTAILVHDDIIDNDNKRRGKDTIHYANTNKFKTYTKDNNELKNLSNSIAICMGDYGLYSANKIISTAYEEDKNLGKVLNYFNDTVLRTIRGELLDVVTPFISKYNLINNDELEKNIMEIYRLKTSHYTIIGPISTGMILAGTTKEQLKDIEIIGEKIGVAFQIQDDILGIYSDEMGKVKGSDIKEAKQTLLYSYNYNTKYKDELSKYYGTENITDEVIEKVQEIFIKSGAKKYAEDLMNKLYDEAIKELKNIKWISNDKKDILEGFIEYLRRRNK